MRRPLSRLDLLAVILFLSVSVRWPVKHSKNTELRRLAAMAKQRLHPINLSSVQSSRSSPQPWSVLFPNTTSHPIKNNLVFIRLNAGTAFAGLTGTAKNRGDLCIPNFSSYNKLLKTSVDSTPTCTRLQRTHAWSFFPPGRSKYYSQEEALRHSLENALFWTLTSSGA